MPLPIIAGAVAAATAARAVYYGHKAVTAVRAVAPVAFRASRSFQATTVAGAAPELGGAAGTVATTILEVTSGVGAAEMAVAAAYKATLWAGGATVVAGGVAAADHYADKEGAFVRESIEKFQAAEREALKKADVWKSAEAPQTGAVNPEGTQPAVTSSPRP